MSEREKQIVADIMDCVKKMPIEKQYQYLGVAQGMGMVPASEKKEEEQK